MKKTACLIVAAVGVSVAAASAAKTDVDSFNGSVNLVGGRHNCYQSAPSRAIASIDADKNEEGQVLNRYLKIRFDKKNTGGKYGKGGWCGWYTLFYQPQSQNPRFLNVEGSTKLVFKVKGEAGGENFRVNLKDQDAEIADMPPPPIDIGSFLPEGKVTTEWQTAEIPLDTFPIDPTRLASFSIAFEHDCYPDGAGAGTVFVDDLAFE